MNRLQFIPFSSYIDTLFFNELSRKKLSEWKLDETPKKIYGTFSNCKFISC